MKTAAAVKERPVIFSGPMVKAILEGRKTQTRRVVKCRDGLDALAMGQFNRCPYGDTGSRLWVRETWRPLVLAFGKHKNQDERGIQYSDKSMIWGDAGDPDCEICNQVTKLNHATGAELDADYDEEKEQPWRSPIHMPRWASRLTLEITNVRVQRLNSISGAEAQAEGIPMHVAEYTFRKCYRDVNERESKRLEYFRDTWEKINGKKHPWASNPWVFALTFRVGREE